MNQLFELEELLEKYPIPLEIYYNEFIIRATTFIDGKRLRISDIIRWIKDPGLTEHIDEVPKKYKLKLIDNEPQLIIVDDSKDKHEITLDSELLKDIDIIKELTDKHKLNHDKFMNLITISKNNFATIDKLLEDLRKIIISEFQFKQIL